MTKGFVINLERRPDRLEGFFRRNAALRDLLHIERVDAVDGGTLDFSEFSHRMVPGLIERLSRREILGLVGCTYSHVKALQHIASLPDPFAIVFEDDAALLNDGMTHALRRILRKIPAGTDLVWLNDWDPMLTPRRRLLQRMQVALPRVMPMWLSRWKGECVRTAEAYLIAPKFAMALASFLVEKFGAADIQMQEYVRTKGGSAYAAYPPMFTQADRRDTDIHLP